ncbi:hypothetical protein F3J23_17800 [Chryseobacterium sp. Tr-659]|uniref:hypothetical protein n=1 Tax=Chryseobacterium sp. Tr-659 TaxID=2608340 RepID=UPI001421DC27|nr:hypothetical protein [Chryseobacterium sp. Tr-659]NIF07277.1 hypothetical protein [Chryseobacterium sp. Tr-659]
MIKKFLLLITFFTTKLIFGQNEVLDKYPYGQDFYAGGLNQLNKEMVKIVKEQKFLPCEKTEEQYNVQILVRENSTISYVKDFDTVNIQKNKCAFDFSRKIIPHLKRWMPAKVNGKFIGAIARIEINPFYLVNSKDDPSKNEKKNPTFKKGIKAFGFEIKSIFERYVKKNEDKRAWLTFVVNENGEMEDLKIEGDFSDYEKKDIINSLYRIKGKWNPATFNNIPIRAKISQPILQQFDLQVELENQNKMMDQNFQNNRYR